MRLPTLQVLAASILFLVTAGCGALTLEVETRGEGTVTSSPAGIDMDSDAHVTSSQKRKFHSVVVHLSVRADAGWVVDKSNTTERSSGL